MTQTTGDETAYGRVSINDQDSARAAVIRIKQGRLMAAGWGLFVCFRISYFHNSTLLLMDYLLRSKLSFDLARTVTEPRPSGSGGTEPSFVVVASAGIPELWLDWRALCGAGARI